MRNAIRNQGATPPPAGGDGAPQRQKWSRGKKITTGAAAGVAALAIAGGVVFGLQPRTHEEASPENTVPPASAELTDEMVEAPAAEAPAAEAPAAPDPAAPAPAPAPAPASDLITVPDLMGMTGMEAQTAAIDGAGLMPLDIVSPKGIYQIPDEQARVVAQSPQPGAQVTKDTVIRVTVAVADPSMPNLVGMTGVDAKAALARLGFEYEWAEWVTADGSPVANPVGRTVIAQSPSVGTVVYPGDVVRITVR